MGARQIWETCRLSSEDQYHLHEWGRLQPLDLHPTTSSTVRDFPEGWLGLNTPVGLKSHACKNRWFHFGCNLELICVKALSEGGTFWVVVQILCSCRMCSNSRYRISFTGPNTLGTHCLLCFIGNINSPKCKQYSLQCFTAGHKSCRLHDPELALLLWKALNWKTQQKFR